MKHLATYMLLVAGGNATPSAEDVTKALSTVGIDADEARLASLIKELEGKVRIDRLARAERVCGTGGSLSTVLLSEASAVLDLWHFGMLANCKAV